MLSNFLRHIPWRRMLSPAIAAALASGANAQLQTIYSMAGPPNDSQAPQGAVAVDNAGNVYGTNFGLGTGADPGNVWRLSPSGMYTVLHTFGSEMDGLNPEGVTVDSSGNLYGTTRNGGMRSSGVVWEITSAGQYQILHQFGSIGNDGAHPYAGVTLNAAGNIFGTTEAGGVAGEGTVWELGTSGQYQVLKSFSGSFTGINPESPVVFDGFGNMYGTCLNGDIGGGGDLWEITALGPTIDLHIFALPDTDGMQPVGTIAVDAAGDVFGTTQFGGTNGSGTIYEYSASRGYSVLNNFAGPTGQPFGLTIDGAGNLYGITFVSPSTVWAVSSAGAFQTLATFAGGAGGHGPMGNVAFTRQGLVGTTTAGGVNGFGTVWNLPLNLVLTTSRGAAPAIAGGVGKSFTATVSLPPTFLGGSVCLASGDSSHMLVADAKNDSPAKSYKYSNLAAGSGIVTFTITAPVDVASATPVTATVTATGLSAAQFTTTIQPFVQAVNVLSTGASGLTTTGSVAVFESPATKQTLNLSTSLTRNGQPTTTTVAASSSVSASFTLNLDRVSAATPETCTASLAGGASSATGSFTDNMPYISGLIFGPNEVGANVATSIIAIITGVTQTAQTITLTSNSSIAGNVTVTIPAGESTGSATVTPGNFASASNQSVSFTGTLGIVPSTGAVATKSAALSVIPYQLYYMETSSPIVAGTSGTITVFLTSPARKNASVTITSANSALISPLTVAIPCGSTYATAPLPVNFVAGNSTVSVVVSGTLNTSPALTQKTTVSVCENDLVQSMSLSSSNISEFDSTTITVNLKYAPSVAGSIPITSSVAGVVANFSIPVIAGQTTATATVTPTFTALAAKKPVTLTATGTTVSQVLDVYPEVLGVSAPSVIAPDSGTILVAGVIDLFDTGSPYVTAAAFSATSSSLYAKIVPNSFLVFGDIVLFNIQVSAVTTAQASVITVTGLGYTRTTSMSIVP